jgi:Ham1 family
MTVQITQLLLGTNNKAKIERYQKFLNVDKNLELITIKSLKNYNLIPNIEEIGNSELENAQIKAKAYYEYFDLPTISEDSGFYIVGLSENLQPRKNVKGIAGVTDDTEPEIKFKLMTDFYSEITNQFGGEVPAYFLDVYSIYDGSTFYNGIAKRHLTLTNEIDVVDFNFPICSLYKVENTLYHSLSNEQMQKFLEPSLTSAKKTIQEFLANYKKL